MTPKKFIAILIIQWLLLALLKAYFFTHQIFNNPGLQQVVFFAAVIIIAAALVRRFGTISFVEALLLVFVWTVLDALLDLLLVSPFAGLSIFTTLQYWMGLLLMDVAVLVLHKKRHLHIRAQMHAHH